MANSLIDAQDETLSTEEASLTPMRGPDGVITNFIATMQDVTEHRATIAATQCREKTLEEAQQIVARGSWELEFQVQ